MNFYPKLILYVSNSGLTAAVFRFGRLKAFDKFQHNEEGYASFGNFLKQYKNITTYFLVDIVEEDYRQEIFPYVTGRDRRHLTERKLEQIYRKYKFRAAIFLKHGANKREAKFLLIALNQTDFISPWFEIIQSKQLPMAGVYPISILSSLVLKNLKIVRHHVLLCESLSSGFRQSYLEGGELVVSRLSSYPKDMNDEQKQLFYLSEIEKTHSYLISQRLVAQQEEISIVMYPPIIKAQLLTEKITSLQNMRFHVLSEDKINQTTSLNKLLLANNPEMFHMQLFASKPIRLKANLAPLAFLKNYYLNQARKSLNLLSGLLIALAFMASFFFFLKKQAIQQEIDQLQTATKVQQMKYEQAAKNFPYSPYPSHQILNVVSFFAALDKSQQTPERLMQIISLAISKLPDIQINRIHWMQTPDINANDVVEQGSNYISRNPNGLVNKSSGLNQVAFINGELKKFNGDYRAALLMVNQMVVQLKRDAGVASVELLQAPVNVSSLSKLEGSTSDELDSRQAPALFKIKMVLNQTPLAQTKAMK